MTICYGLKSQIVHGSVDSLMHDLTIDEHVANWTTSTSNSLSANQKRVLSGSLCVADSGSAAATLSFGGHFCTQKSAVMNGDEW